jgi:ubiquitin-conjugating enzyme E2 O
MNTTAGKLLSTWLPSSIFIHLPPRPGDHVLWKNEDGRRFAVVQSVDPDARTAKLHLEDTNTTELAPVLELDPNGSSDPSQNDPSTAFDGFGVRRGDFVFIHREGTTNGCVKPRVPRIGELEPWVRELPHLDGSLNDWRQELADLGQKLATDREPTAVVEKLSTQDSSLQWFGEVSEVRRWTLGISTSRIPYNPFADPIRWQH